MSLLSTRLREERRWSRPPDLTIWLTADTERFDRAMEELAAAAARAARALATDTPTELT